MVAGQKTSEKTQPVATPVDALEDDEMIQFEKADLQEERGYVVFEKLWTAKSKAMVAHALASHGVFKWNGFKMWLKTKAASDCFAKASLPSFGIAADGESGTKSGEYRELKDVLPMIRSLHPNGDLTNPRVQAPPAGAAITRTQLLYLIAAKAPDSKNFMKAVDQMRADGNKVTKEEIITVIGARLYVAMTQDLWPDKSTAMLFGCPDNTEEGHLAYQLWIGMRMWFDGYRASLQNEQQVPEGKRIPGLWEHGRFAPHVHFVDACVVPWLRDGTVIDNFNAACKSLNYQSGYANDIRRIGVTKIKWDFEFLAWIKIYES